MQVGAGFVWHAQTGLVEVLQTYGLNDFPVDIDDAGQIGNYKTQTITVRVGSAETPTVRVSSVTLSASTKKSATTVTAAVAVVTQTGTPAKSAGVWVSWTTPAGSAHAFAYTDRKGIGRSRHREVPARTLRWLRA